VFFFLTSGPPKLQCTRRDKTYRKGGNLIEFNEAETRLLKRKNSSASRGYAAAQYSRFFRKTFRLPTQHYLPVVVITLGLIKSGTSPRYNRPLLPSTLPANVPQKNKYKVRHGTIPTGVLEFKVKIMTYFRGDRRGIIRKRYTPNGLENMCSARVFRSWESARSFAPTRNFYGRQNVCCRRGSHVFRSIKSISISRDCATAFTSPSHTPQDLTHSPILFHRCHRHHHHHPPPHNHWMLFYCHVRNRRIQRASVGIKNRMYVYRNQTEFVPVWVWKKKQRVRDVYQIALSTLIACRPFFAVSRFAEDKPQCCGDSLSPSFSQWPSPEYPSVLIPKYLKLRA